MGEGEKTLDELKISFNGDKVCEPNEESIINVISSEEELEYKFIIGNDGVWNTIQDFSDKSACKWIPKEKGKYMIMVQGKKEGSNKPFDFMAKEEIVVNDNKNRKIIKQVIVSNTSVFLGEKIYIELVSEEEEVLYRFWKSGKNGWEPLRDYSNENKYVFTAIEEGQHEILIESKRLNSKEKVDEFKTIKFEVSLPLKIEITDFKCLTEDRLINNELVFKVETTFSENRCLIYKFIKINKEGKAVCIQDYSSRKIVTYQEKIPGEYKLLCLVRDLLSKEEFDDRAIIHYDVIPYKEIKINSFEADLPSPQLKGTEIIFNSNVSGGRELLYRYIVEGPYCEDTGYIRNKNYAWKPNEDGEYNISLLVKDISCDTEFEDRASIEFSIDRKSDRPVKIKEIISNNRKRVIVGNPVNIKVNSEGGIIPLYSFIVYKDNIEMERIEYSESNWVNFIPEEKGIYEIEVRVKDKYSSREYDSNVNLNIRCLEYYPAEIDYVLCKNTENYIVGDTISLNVIAQNTDNVLVKYVTKINGHIIEETEFGLEKKLILKPRSAGKYTIDIYAKNIKCTEGYDVKKDVHFYVVDTLPVRDCEITIENEEIKLNNQVTVYANSKGGKQVCYEFYIMEGNNWVKVQEYSRKNYYTFIPFLTGKHKVLVLARSFYKKINYEDYSMIEFEVE